MFFLFSFLITSGLLTILIFIFKCIWIKKTKTRTFFQNAILFIFTTIYLLLFIELYFLLFVTETDGLNFTLASKKYFLKYWKPINSFGYRDIEHTSSEFRGKKIIFVVGDSFVAGHGIKNYNDRFSDILQYKLGSGFTVVNIAKRGWSTIDEYNAIISYPVKPDLIILSYYIDDIDGAMMSLGLESSFLVIMKMLKLPRGILKPFIKHSYLLNYLYRKLYYPSREIDRIILDYHKYLKDGYHNQKVWEIHKQYMMKIIDYAKDNEVGLIFIIFPTLCDIKNSKIITSRVVDFLNLQQVRTIDVSNIFQNRKSQEMIVSQLDPHPNEKVNKKIAELLFREIVGIEKKDIRKE